MDKNILLKNYKKEEDKLLISKLLDKIQLVQKQNSIQYTSFLSPIEQVLLEKVLNLIKYENYIIYGGSNTERKLIILYPTKLDNIFIENKFDYNVVCNCIRITNFNEILDHKLILGGLIKLGVKREKIGDIIIDDNIIDIIVSKDITKFLLSNLSQLTRFKNSEIDIININNCINKKQKFEDIKIIVSSLRLDNIVAELAKTSRSKAIDILNQERVFINYQNETKNTKIVKQNDIITVRGKGKFIIEEIVGNTRSGRFIINIKKYI